MLDSERDDEEDSDAVSIIEQPTQPASASATQQEARAQQLVSALREEHEAHSDAPGVHEEESEEEDDEDEDDEDDEDEEPTLKYEKFGSDVMNALKRDTASAIAVANKRVVSRLGFFPASSPECSSGSGNTYGYRSRHGSHREHCQDVSTSRRIRP
jgi:hypothetical protein